MKVEELGKRMTRVEDVNKEILEKPNHLESFLIDIYYKALMSYPVIAAGLSAIAAQTSYTVILNISNVTAYANNGILSHGNFFFHCNGNGLTIHLHKINSSHSNGTGLIPESVTP